MDFFSLKFDALFLPDTQQALLENEQKILRRIFSGMGNNPFCLFPPCIPLGYPEAEPEGDGLEAFPPETEGGWIIRRTNLRIPDGNPAQKKNGRNLPPPFQDFPLHPSIVLGFAGEKSGELLGLYRKERCSRLTETEKLRSEVWYRTEVFVDIQEDPGVFFNSTWRTGAPVWKKRCK